MNEDDRFREEFRGEVRRIDQEFRRVDRSRAEQEVALVSLKGDTMRIEDRIRTGTAMTIGETFVAFGNRLGAIEAGEVERKDFARWMKRVFPYTIIGLALSLLAALLSFFKMLKGG